MQVLIITMHHFNLCNLPVEIQQAIETDKQRWFKAYQMVRDKTTLEIKAYIESIEDDIERKDMRDKLNECYRNKNGS